MHSNSLTVSVVIPAYNVEAYVGEAVASALQQTYAVEEVVIVDDGSTDRTLAMIQRYKEQYPERLRVLTGPHQGASAARNRGMELATGEYIQFLDADDLILPEKIARDVDVLSSHRAPLLFGSYEQSEGGGRACTRSTFVSRNPWVCLARQNFGMTSANLFHAGAVRHAGGWDESRPYNQDYDLMVRMLKTDHDVAFGRHVCTHIRRRKGSISYAYGPEMRMARIELDHDILTYLRSLEADADIIAEIEESVFLALRQLASLERAEATRLHRKVFPSGYTPVAGGANSLAYCILYRVLGFKAAEFIKVTLQKGRP